MESEDRRPVFTKRLILTILVIILIILIILLLLRRCGSGSGNYSVISINASPLQLNLDVGESERILAQVEPSDAKNTRYYCTSQNPEVATVDSDCVVTGVGNGTTTIIVTSEDGGKTTTVEVNVGGKTPNLSGIRFQNDTYTVNVGRTILTNVIPVPEDAKLPALQYQISDPKIATVDENGFVKGVKVGTTTLTATAEDGKYNATTTIKVIKKSGSGSTCKSNQTLKNGKCVDLVGKPTALILTEPAKTIYTGETYKPGFRIEPSSASQEIVCTVPKESQSILGENNCKLTGLAPGVVTVKVCTKADKKICANLIVTVTAPYSGGSGGSGGSGSGSGSSSRSCTLSYDKKTSKLNLSWKPTGVSSSNSAYVVTSGISCSQYPTTSCFIDRPGTYTASVHYRDGGSKSCSLTVTEDDMKAYQDTQKSVTPSKPTIGGGPSDWKDGKFYASIVAAQGTTLKYCVATGTTNCTPSNTTSSNTYSKTITETTTFCAQAVNAYHASGVVCKTFTKPANAGNNPGSSSNVLHTCKLTYDSSTNKITLTATASNGSAIQTSSINGYPGTTYNPTKSGTYAGEVYFKDGYHQNCPGISVTVPSTATTYSCSMTRNGGTVGITGVSASNGAKASTYIITGPDGTHSRAISTWQAQAAGSYTGKVTFSDGHTKNCSGSVTITTADLPGPVCGTVVGASTTWTNQSRTISVACSTCKKTSYSKTFSSTAKTGTIEIEGINGSKTNCTVNVYVDKNNPIIGCTNVSSGSSGVSLNVQAVDTGSGIKTSDAGSKSGVTTNQTYKATDNAGNASSITLTVTRTASSSCPSGYSENRGLDSSGQTCYKLIGSTSCSGTSVTISGTTQCLSGVNSSATSSYQACRQYATGCSCGNGTVLYGNSCYNKGSFGCSSGYQYGGQCFASAAKTTTYTYSGTCN